MSRNRPPVDAFRALKADIDAALWRLIAASQAGFEASLNEVSWEQVETLTSALDRLRWAEALLIPTGDAVRRASESATAVDRAQAILDLITAVADDPGNGTLHREGFENIAPPPSEEELNAAAIELLRRRMPREGWSQIVQLIIEKAQR